MLHFFHELLARYGYFAVALFMISEGCGIPVPSTTLLVTAAAIASRGTLSIWGVAIAGVVGALIGASAGYGLGAQGGIRLIRRFGAKLWIDEKKITRSQKFFERYGVWAAFFARFVGVIRIIVPMLAGVSRMSFARFSAANAAGVVAAVSFYSTLGYFFGRDLPKLAHHLTEASLVVAGLVAGWLVLRWVRRGAATPSRREVAAGSEKE